MNWSHVHKRLNGLHLLYLLYARAFAHHRGMECVTFRQRVRRTVAKPAPNLFVLYLDVQ